MKYLKIKHYLSVLLSEGTKWEYEELLPVTPSDARTVKRYSWSKRVILLIPTIAFFFLLKNGFTSDFMNYVMTSLSIFIGLFTNLIIVLYQRYPKKVQSNSVSDLDAINSLKIRNFIKQFTFVTGKNLFIATAIIVLLSIFMLFKNLANLNYLDYCPVKHFTDIDRGSIKLFVKVFAAVSLRGLILYALIDFTLLLFYSLGSLFSFLKGEYY